ncbi:MAG: GNAT family N-acetyltransferase [Paracoccaceae bacterium]
MENEAEGDGPAVEALFDLCFGPARTALSSYRLREGVAPVPGLCRVIRDDGLAGAVRVWPVRVGAAPALLLGPIAVHPTRQGEGLAAWMMADVIARAREGGHPRLMLVGDLAYYGRFGLARVEGVIMPPPTDPNRVLGMALMPGGWDGVTGAVGRIDASA